MKLVFLGPPGAGKGTFARYIHEQSPRRDGPFVEIAVGSISRENSAAELFGHEDAETIHYGRLEQAYGEDGEDKLLDGYLVSKCCLVKC